MAVKIAEEMAALFPDFRYDRHLLIGACLCHDIGKVWEFDPENVWRGNADPRANGRTSIRPLAFGLYICQAMGLPEGKPIAPQLIRAKASWSSAVSRTKSCTKLTTRSGAWRTLGAVQQIAIPGLDGELAAQSGAKTLWRGSTLPCALADVLCS